MQRTGENVTMRGLTPEMKKCPCCIMGVGGPRLEYSWDVHHPHRGTHAGYREETYPVPPPPYN